MDHLLTLYRKHKRSRGEEDWGRNEKIEGVREERKEIRKARIPRWCCTEIRNFTEPRSSVFVGKHSTLTPPPWKEVSWAEMYLGWSWPQTWASPPTRPWSAGAPWWCPAAPRPAPCTSSSWPSASAWPTPALQPQRDRPRARKSAFADEHWPHPRRSHKGELSRYPSTEKY